MKNSTLIPALLILLSIIVTGCKKEHPRASFHVSNSNVFTEEIIYFENESVNAYSYHWDFGNGYTSTQTNPSHYYIESGEYIVTLSAFSRDGEKVHETSRTVYVHQTTDLYIQVKLGGIPISDCYVDIYTSQYDWEESVNIYAYGLTDKFGVVSFENIDPITLYVDAWKEINGGMLNNWYLGYILDEIVPNEKNYYEIDVEISANKSGYKVKRVVKKDASTFKTKEITNEMRENFPDSFKKAKR